MPFDFLKRRKPAAAAPEAAAAPAAGAAGIPFDGMTEDWHLVGRMMIDGRLSDALNKREPIALEDVTWAPADGSAPMAPAPGLKSVDPYDLVLVLTGDDSLPGMTNDERNAHKVHKVSYEVALEAPPYRVVGTVYLYPGSEPNSLLQRSSDMFVPIVDASAFLGQAADRVGPVRDGPRQSPVSARRRTGRRPDRGAPREAARVVDGRHQLDRPVALTRR